MGGDDDLSELQVASAEEIAQLLHLLRRFLLQLILQFFRLLHVFLYLQLPHHIALHSGQLEEDLGIFLPYFGLLLLLQVVGGEGVVPAAVFDGLGLVAVDAFDLCARFEMVGESGIEQFVAEDLIFLVDALLEGTMLPLAVLLLVLEVQQHVMLVVAFQFAFVAAFVVVDGVETTNVVEPFGFDFPHFE